MRKLFPVIRDRAKEPSTAAGIAALAALAGVNLDPGILQNASLAVTGIAGLLSIALPEKGPR